MTDLVGSTPFDVEHEDDSGHAFPWAPQPGETSIGFAAFCAYRDLGARRTIAAVARQVDRDSGTLRALSSKYSWVDRALAFDAYLDRRAVEDLARGRTAMRQEHADIADLAKRKIVTRLRSLDPDEMSVRDLATWMDLAVKMERQARGEPDKVVEVGGTINIAETLDAAGRRSLMAEALAVLNERLGIPEPGELEAAIVEAEVVEEDDDGGAGEGP